MDFGWWIILLPVLVAFVLYYLFFFVIGAGLLGSGVKSRKLFPILIGLGVVTAPFTLQKLRELKAEQKADAVYEQLAALERTSLKGRLPRKFVAVGNLSDSDVNFIRNRYGLTPFPEAENDRLKAAYRTYRKTEYCYKYIYERQLAYREKHQPWNKLPICKPLPDSLQAALKIKEPVLFFVEGSAISYRRSNISIGEKYEIRLVTPREDLLVEYYEQREVDDPKGVTNSFSSGRKLDTQEPPLRMREFIQTAMKDASR